MVDEYNNYFNWLCSKVGIVKGMPNQCYWMLAKALYNKPFDIDPDDPVVSVRNDWNRYEDGIELRNNYILSNPGSLPWLTRNEPCNMLEMLIALAHRIDQDIMGNDEKDEVSKWFWVMIDNLGLSSMYNASFDEAKVDMLLDILIHRNYSRNGEGGLFPLDPRINRKDQRKVEIWYQMQEYLEENYPRTSDFTL